MNLRRENVKMVGKLAVVAAGMFAFGYALVPIYKAICEMTGINVLALGERNLSGAPTSLPANTQVDTSRSITVEFDANSRGPWQFKPAQRSLQVHPGELTTSFKTCKTGACPRRPFPVMRPSRPANISTSWSAFASSSTPWSPVKKNRGRWRL